LASGKESHLGNVYCVKYMKENGWKIGNDGFPRELKGPELRGDWSEYQRKKWAT
jgi:hypothetical protein